MDNDGNVSSLKTELNNLDRTKEEFFAQSKVNRAKLIEVRTKVNALKNERNALTDAVKKIKVERDTSNKELKEKIEAFKKLVPVKKTTEKPKERVNVAFIKKEIKDMEYKIETEGLDFSKEQKMMKIIKEKKKLLEGSEPVHLSPEAKALSNEIDTIRARADEAHKNMRTQADLSQKKHEEVIKLSNELKELEKKQKELDNNCREYKVKVHDVNETLKTKLSESHAPKEHHSERRKYGEKHEHKEKKSSVNIDEMERKVEEKIKKGEKLTTQDLLVFQAKR